MKELGKGEKRDLLEVGFVIVPSISSVSFKTCPKAIQIEGFFFPILWLMDAKSDLILPQWTDYFPTETTIQSFNPPEKTPKYKFII